MSDELIREFARLAVAEYERDDAEQDAEARRIEAEGYRLVTGGQEGSSYEDGRSDWAVRDYRTGELLISGHGTYEDYSAEAAAAVKARGERWYQHDSIWLEMDMPLPTCPVVDGVPPSLAEAVFEWVAEGAAEEVAAWIGISPERVRRIQS